MKAWTRRGAPRTLKPPTMDEIREDECRKMGEIIGLLSYKDPVLRRRLAKYLEKLQKIQLEAPIPAE